MKFLRYVGVQVVAYGIDMGSFLLFLHLAGFGPLTANVLGKLLAGLFAFFAHRAFTFAVPGADRQASQALRYFLLLALNLPLSSLVLAALLQVIAAEVPAKFLADVVCVCLTYWLSKHYVFTRLGAPAAAREDERP